MQELNIRNQARQMNSEIAAKNKQIKYENEVDGIFAHKDSYTDDIIKLTETWQKGT